MSKKILLLGSGYVARPCAEYVLRRPENTLTIGARRIELVEKLAQQFPGRATAISIDVTNQDAMDKAVAEHDIVISLVPYIYHAVVIQSAIKFKKHVVTTSYVSDSMRAFDEAAKAAGITIMNEIGLDPGIDHLYAVRIIDQVHAEGGKIITFRSFCGGLPAPEASNNPLGYKFSWSSRGVLLALRNNAKYWQDGEVVEIPGSALMDSAKRIRIYPAFALEGYPNRDSTPYKERYNIPEAKTIIRGTLRYEGFPAFVKALVLIGLLDDKHVDYLADDAPAVSWKQVLGRVLGVDATLDALVPAIQSKVQVEAERIVSGMRWLGMFSDAPAPRRASNLLDTLCATLEGKMAYGKDERDMVLLQHYFDIELADGSKQTRTSTLLAYGVPGGDSAMATTVGVPCGIAVQLILDGVIADKGVLAPLSMGVIDPLIEALEKEGITMADEIY